MKKSRMKVLFVLGATMLAGLLAGCGTQQNVASGEKLDYVDITVNQLQLHLELAGEDKTLELESLNTENELPIRITSKADGYNVTFDVMRIVGRYGFYVQA